MAQHYAVRANEATERDGEDLGSLKLGIWGMHRGENWVTGEPEAYLDWEEVPEDARPRPVADLLCMTQVRMDERTFNGRLAVTVSAETARSTVEAVRRVHEERVGLCSGDCYVRHEDSFFRLNATPWSDAMLARVGTVGPTDCNGWPDEFSMSGYYRSYDLDDLLTDRSYSLTIEPWEGGHELRSKRVLDWEALPVADRPDLLDDGLCIANAKMTAGVDDGRKWVSAPWDRITAAIQAVDRPLWVRFEDRIWQFETLTVTYQRPGGWNPWRPAWWLEEHGDLSLTWVDVPGSVETGEDFEVTWRIDPVHTDPDGLIRATAVHGDHSVALGHMLDSLWLYGDHTKANDTRNLPANISVTITAPKQAGILYVRATATYDGGMRWTAEEAKVQVVADRTVHTVEIGNTTGRVGPLSEYDPGTVKVAASDAVRWANLDPDGQVHTASWDAGAPEAFDTGDVGPGNASEPIVFDEPGTYAYRCAYHPDTMQGEIVVT